MWATYEDLIIRLGEKKVHELATRHNYDPLTETYIGSTDESNYRAVVEAALNDSKTWLLWKISCCFDVRKFNSLINDGQSFPVVFNYHFKMTVAQLKFGGDCEDCEKCKIDFSALCKCKAICTEDGQCLEKPSRFAVSENKVCDPPSLCCACKKESCCCGK